MLYFWVLVCRFCNVKNSKLKVNFIKSKYFKERFFLYLVEMLVIDKCKYVFFIFF